MWWSLRKSGNGPRSATRGGRSGHTGRVEILRETEVYMKLPVIGGRFFRVKRRAVVVLDGKGRPCMGSEYHVALSRTKRGVVCIYCRLRVGDVL